MTTSIAIYCLSKQSVVGIFPYTEEFEQRLKKEYDLIPDKEDYEFLYVGFDYSNLEEWCRERLKEADIGKEAAKQKISCECSFDDYLKYRPKAWEELADKLWDGLDKLNQSCYNK